MTSPAYNEGTRVFPLESGNGISIRDTSTQPCCGCTQLDEIKQSVQDVEDSRAQMLMVAEQLRARIANLTAILLNAGLNPPSSPSESAEPDCWWWLPVGPGGYGSVVVPCP